jgi:hypothetical protein
MTTEHFGNRVKAASSVRVLSQSQASASSSDELSASTRLLKIVMSATTPNLPKIKSSLPRVSLRFEVFQIKKTL